MKCERWRTIIAFSPGFSLPSCVVCQFSPFLSDKWKVCCLPRVSLAVRMHFAVIRSCGGMLTVDVLKNLQTALGIGVTIFCLLAVQGGNSSGKICSALKYICGVWVCAKTMVSSIQYTVYR